LALTLDTHVLVWIATGDARLSEPARAAIESPDQALRVSAVIAWEYSDLEQRGRFPGSGPLPGLQAQLGFSIDELPADLFKLAATLPDHHRDPVDRMFLAHAMMLGSTPVTADRVLSRYPIDILW